jgi:aspartyl/glutamyl-tRNA(Asn/Gln) amidotransferase C subunit
VEKLKEVDVKDVVPTSQATGLQSVMRADEAIKKDKKEQGVILANTPESKDGYIKVKAVFE